jgi:hypothetical protein
MKIEALCARESDFAELLTYGDEMELLRQQRILTTELEKRATTRTPVTELMRERLQLLNINLGIATAA